MKLKKQIFLLVSCCVFLFIGSSIARAEYPNYLQGNRNYLLCGGHMGCGWYLDKTSLVVQQANHPNYLLTVDVVEVANADRGNTTITSRNNCRYSYDEKQKKMYSFWDDKWHYVEPVGSMAQTGHEFSGEMAFYIAFHKKFYGGRKWWDPYTNKYESPNFSEVLYARVDRAQ